jgi:hypothetical protein
VARVWWFYRLKDLLIEFLYELLTAVILSVAVALKSTCWSLLHFIHRPIRLSLCVSAKIG